ncbi:MAG: hypothetical protein GX162_07315 [Firmicutes bacterium]|nr:hypothetical protein [Bacillota bacterium]
MFGSWQCAVVAGLLAVLLVSLPAMGKEDRHLESYNFVLPERPYTLVAIDYLENVSPDHLPQSAATELFTFVTPGEYEPLSFVIYAQQDLSTVQVRVSDLCSSDHVIKSENIELRCVRWMARRWRYSAPPAPENLVPDPFFLETYRPFDLGQGQMKQIWLTLRVPEEAAPGQYVGYVRVSAIGHDEMSLPVRVEVLPFALHDSEKRLSIYYRNYKARTAEQRHRDFLDMRNHGLRHAIVRPSITYQVRRIDGVFRFVPNLSEVRTVIEEMRQYGFEGPYVVNSGFTGLWAQLEGVPQPTRSELYRSILVDLGEAIMALEEELGVEIALQQLDEIFKTEVRERYELLTRPAADVEGLRFYITFYPHEDVTLMEWADPLVDIRNYHGAAADAWLARGRTFDDLAGYVNQEPDRLWLYYNAEEVEMDPRWMRIINGIYLWLSPFELHAIWAYSEPEGDLFDDADGIRGSMGMAFIDPRDGSLLSTRHWEAYREGGDDLRYLATLEHLMEEHTDTAPSAIAAARRYLEELKTSWWPEKPLAGRRGTQGAIVRAMNAEHPLGSLQSLRRQVADHILAILRESAGAQK